MREIKVDLIRQTVSELAQRANFVLRPDAATALKAALAGEKQKRTRKILRAILDNARIARSQSLAICQDTGLPVVFVELGQEARILGGSLLKAINQGIGMGYKKGSLRDSIVNDPITRGKSGFSPAVIHTDIVSGDKLKLTVLPKGFGCENKGQVRMFNPTAGLDEIKDFILGVVKNAGPDACPPFVIGVGIGGTQDYACLLAKKALLKSVVRRPSSVARRPCLAGRQASSAYGIRNTEYGIRHTEQELLKEINKLNIGPMGLGGKTTCLGVNIKTYPTHIAGLPVAVNISCHALRSASRVI